ncbi:MAG: GNAT family N-acetyltransferase, partial [Rhodospirillales bacterium]|nr:GNAT family N-acetyltransferase [Rhodospirillales bacterium]
MAPTAPETDAPSGCFAAGSSWQGGPLPASRLSLRRPRPGDAEAFLRLAGDPAIASRTANIPIPYSLEQAQAFIAESERDFHQGKAVVLVLE